MAPFGQVRRLIIFEATLSFGSKQQTLILILGVVYADQYLHIPGRKMCLLSYIYVG